MQRIVTKHQIKRALWAGGLTRGDRVVVHSSLRQIGRIDGRAEAVLEALLEAIGPEGTLAMPTFSDLPRPASTIYDPAKTPSVTGALTEVFRRRPGAHRSLHPTHSITVMGPDAEAIIADHLGVECNGLGSPLDKIARAGGKVLLLGVSHVSNTTVHIGEAHAGVEKVPRWAPAGPPRVRVRREDGKVISHPLDASASCSFGFNAVDLPLRSRGLVRDLALGNAVCHLMLGRDVIAATAEVAQRYPGILFCTREECVRCRLSRRRALRNTSARHGGA